MGVVKIGAARPPVSVVGPQYNQQESPVQAQGPPVSWVEVLDTGHHLNCHPKADEVAALWDWPGRHNGIEYHTKSSALLFV